jgi:hypothetical protein
MKLRPFDYVAVAVSLAIVAGFAVFAYAGRGRRGEVRVEASGTQYVYPLSGERRIAVQGPLGETIVVIRGGKAAVEDSPCPDKLCVHMAAISKPGQWIACLPNKVFVRVSGTSGEQVDDSSY